MILLGVALVATPAAAQIDYRNLDRGRPGLVEDAYPIERYGFEFMGGYRLTRLGPGVAEHLLEPELSHGLARGLGVSVGMPVAVSREGASPGSGIAGLHLAAKYNLTTERPSLPGLALRLDGALPVGALGGDEASVELGLLATRSVGRNRVHLNLGASLSGEPGAGSGEQGGRWRAGVAVDRTLLRSSTLLIAEGGLERGWDDETTWRAGVGIRRQLTPMVVLDAGIAFHEFSVTLGFSRAFGLAGLIPRGAR